MKTQLITIAIALLMLPALASAHQRGQLSKYKKIEQKSLEILETVYDIPVKRASDLSCFTKKPNLLDRILKNKKYKRHILKRKNNDLCQIEYKRIDIAADNLDAFNNMKLKRNAKIVLSMKLKLTQRAIIDDIEEREDRMSALSCDKYNSNIDLCIVEEDVIDVLEFDLLPAVNLLMRQLRRLK